MPKAKLITSLINTKSTSSVRSDGFTLIEALIAICISIILVTIIASGITAFSSEAQDRVLKTCLIEGAESALATCKAGNITNNFTCGKYNIRITIEGNCNPQNTCNNVKVRAEAQGQVFELTDMVCNLSS